MRMPIEINREGWHEGAQAGKMRERKIWVLILNREPECGGH